MGSIKSFFRRGKKDAKTEGTPISDVPSPARTPQEELQIVFAKYDANGDGKISSSELAAVLESLGGHPPSEDEISTMMAEADRDGDGFISFSEFLEVNTVNVYPDDALKDLRDAFSIFDTDCNGSISAEELARVLTKLGESVSIAKCRRMIEGVDRDGDGMINFEEFRIMMSSASFPNVASVERR